jgi:drug/metabolite transporter (DMT)-like permease
MPASLLPYLWMLLGALAFAVMAFLTADLRDNFNWQWIAIARSGLAMVFGALLVVAGGAQFVLLRPRTLWMRSLAGSVSLVCGFYAMTHFDVAIVLTLTNMYPLWVAVLSWPLLGHAPSGDTWLAALVGIVGVAVLVGGMGNSGGAIPAGPSSATVAVESGAAELQQVPLTGVIAIVAALVSAFTSAIALIGLHRLKEIDSRAIVTHFSLVSLLACIGALFVFGDEMPQPPLSRGAIAALLGVGLTATAGQLFLTKAFSTGIPARVSVVGLSQVGFAMLLEMLFHGKQFAPRTIVGMALIIAPTAWVLFRGQAESTELETGDTTI